MALPIRQFWNSTVKQRLLVALPLIPALSGMLLFIAMLSPIAWNDKGCFNYKIGLLAIGLGFVSAYCVAMFSEDCLKKYGGKDK